MNIVPVVFRSHIRHELCIPRGTLPSFYLENCKSIRMVIHTCFSLIFELCK
jgi:hypothetical protein